MAKFETVLPALRAGKKVRRPGWYPGVYIQADGCDIRFSDRAHLTIVGFSGIESLYADDWEVVDEPKRVADYLVESLDDCNVWFRHCTEIGKQPEGAVLIPGTERTEESCEAVPGSEREEV